MPRCWLANGPRKLRWRPVVAGPASARRRRPASKSGRISRTIAHRDGHRWQRHRQPAVATLLVARRRVAARTTIALLRKPLIHGLLLGKTCCLHRHRKHRILSSIIGIGKGSSAGHGGGWHARWALPIGGSPRIGGKRATLFGNVTAKSFSRRDAEAQRRKGMRDRKRRGWVNRRRVGQSDLLPRLLLP